MSIRNSKDRWNSPSRETASPISWNGDGSASLSDFVTQSRSSEQSYDLATDLSYSTSTLGYLSDSRQRSSSRQARARQLVKMRRRLEEEIRLEQRKQRLRARKPSPIREPAPIEQNQVTEQKKYQEEIDQLLHKHREEIDKLAAEQVGAYNFHVELTALPLHCMVQLY